MTTITKTPAPSLLRALGPFMAMAIVIGSTIGSGIFKKPQSVAENVDYFGPIMLVWILGGLLSLMGSLSLSEVAALFPEAGGGYVFLRESFGRLSAFLFGWVEFWIIQAAGLAALAVVFTDELANFLIASGMMPESGSNSWLTLPLTTYWGRQWMTVAMIMLMAGINIRGVLWGGWMQSFITSIKVATLVGILVLPFLALSGSLLTEVKPKAEYLSPLWPGSFQYVSMTGFGIALVGVLWAYNGWMNLAYIAGEIKRPQRNLPIALIGGVGVIIFLYVGANVAYALIMSHAEIKGAKDVAVVTRFAQMTLGPIGSATASAALMISVFGAFNGCLMTAPRIVYAMSEDGMAPRPLAAVHPSYHTPARSILLFAVWSALLVLGAAAITKHPLPSFRVGDMIVSLNPPEGDTPFDVLTNFAIFGVVLFETLAVASIFYFRRAMPNIDRPYRCHGYPWVPALYVAIMAVVAAHMFTNHRRESLAGMVFIGIGAAAYGMIARRAPRASA
jgi:basic amino acid/polyamine antiporter, APA family